MDLHDILGEQLGEFRVPALDQKVHYADASYSSPGPFPFVCGNCKFLVFGPSAEPDQAQQISENPEQGGDLCQLVHGPYDYGKVDPSDTCRLWAPKPQYVTAAPIAHEYTGEHVGSQDAQQDGTGPDEAATDGPPE